MTLGGGSGRKARRGKGKSSSSSRRRRLRLGSPASSSSSSSSSALADGVSSYPMDSGVPCWHQQEHQRSMDGDSGKGSLHTGPVTRVVYARDASHIATASADRSALTMRLPAARFRGERHRHRYLGHNAPVHCVDWSHGGGHGGAGGDGLLLTAASDGTARLWQRGRPDAVLTFSHWQRSPARSAVAGGGGAGGDSSSSSGGGGGGSGSMAALAARQKNRPRGLQSSGSSSTGRLRKRGGTGGGGGHPHQNKSNPPFGSTQIAQCGFFHLDRFVLLAVGDSLCLHKYTRDTFSDPNNDLRRLQNRSRHKLVGRWRQPAQSVTGFACANALPSGVVVTSGSNRAVTVYDLAAGGGGREAARVPDAHARSVTRVVLPPISDYCSHARAAYDAFLTVGAEGSVKLWDLRACGGGGGGGGPVRRFESQPRARCVAVDPTMRFVACASREAPNVLCVHDLRGGRGLLERLQCGSEAVHDAAFSPRHPQLCVGSADGRLRFFGAGVTG